MLGVRLYLLIIVSAHIRYRIVWSGIVPPVAGWAVLMGRKVRDVSKEVQTALARQDNQQDMRHKYPGFPVPALFLIGFYGFCLSRYQYLPYLFGRLKDNICRDSPDFRLAG